MNGQPGSIEEKIIFATIECIEKYGISGATNRQIAQAAGVNLAAINYYFRSKDVLIQRVMEITLENAFDLSDLPLMPEVSAQARAVAAMEKLIEGGQQYPGLTRAHFHTLLAEGQRDPLLERHVNGYLDKLAADLQGRAGVPEPAALRLGLVQVLSAVVFTALTPGLFAGLQQVDLTGPEQRRAYITRLVERLL